MVMKDKAEPKRCLSQIGGDEDVRDKSMQHGNLGQILDENEGISGTSGEMKSKSSL